VRLPVSGHPLHTRSLTVTVSAGEGTHLAVHAEVIDLRKSGFVPMADEIQTAGIIHHMIFDAAVDSATRRLESLTAAQRAVAFEPSEATRGESCRDPLPRLQQLVGKRFGPDFSAELSRAYGGPRGCSHLLTLFHLAASALPGALDFEAEQLRKLRAARRRGERLFRRSVAVDGYETENGLELVVQLVDIHGRPRAAVTDRLTQLARQSEVRLFAAVRLSDVAIERLELWERERTPETLAEAEWQDRGAWVQGLALRPVMPGLGTELRRRLAEPGKARALDALLQLAPGFVQCTPALADRMLGRLGGPSAAGVRGRLPGFMALGGMPDSCYMWRADGPLVQIGPAAEGD
jgi:hypothetical protein